MPNKPNTFNLNPKPKRIMPRDTRKSASQRGYTSRWRTKNSKAQLIEEPLCRACKAQGKTVRATVADHIIPKRKGGTDITTNLQSLCATCHNIKTRRGE